MGKLRKNDSKSFPHVQDRFTGEVGKLFDKEHPGRECPNSVFIRVLFCALDISFRDLLLRLDQSLEIDLAKPDPTRQRNHHENNELNQI
ncbi:MAG: hypothetical protein FWH27_13550, partial [Planctomycetaceae bacterium]|nr:hypothetical protein [Planctomycetaceae bacterium]